MKQAAIQLIYTGTDSIQTENQNIYWKKGARSWTNEHIPDGFQSTTSQSSTELIINSVTLSDSALYYCALRVFRDTKYLRSFTKTHTK